MRWAEPTMYPERPALRLARASLAASGSGTRPADQPTPRAGGQSHAVTSQQLLAWPHRPDPGLCVGQNKAGQTAGRRPQLLGGSGPWPSPSADADSAADRPGHGAGHGSVPRAVRRLCADPRLCYLAPCGPGKMVQLSLSLGFLIGNLGPAVLPPPRCRGDEKPSPESQDAQRGMRVAVVLSSGSLSSLSLSWMREFRVAEEKQICTPHPLDFEERSAEVGTRLGGTEEAREEGLAFIHSATEGTCAGRGAMWTN